MTTDNTHDSEADAFPLGAAPSQDAVTTAPKRYVRPKPSAALEPTVARGHGETDENGEALISELRDMCEEALLSPQDCLSKRPVRALETRSPKGDAFSRDFGTTHRVADRMSRLLRQAPRLRSQLLDFLLHDDACSDNPHPSSEALRLLGEVEDFLDHLGCPRGEDDRNFTPAERIRRLLDSLAAKGGAARAPLQADITPATGQRWVRPPFRKSDPAG
jgi:hypothetical protein